MSNSFNPDLDFEVEYRDDKTSLASRNEFDNALVSLSNLIARATTKWSLKESKMFLCAVSKIKTRDEQNYVHFSKKDLMEKLNIDPSNKGTIRDTIKKVVFHSYVQFGTTDSGEWNDGVLLTNFKTTSDDVYIKFNEVYIPLLDELANHFTMFHLEEILSFNHISSYNLYIYLTSWTQPNYLHQNKKLPKRDIAQVFHLKPNEYWVTDKKGNTKFHWKNFETSSLNPAIDDINTLCSEGKTDMRITSCEKVKKGKTVLGYDFKYVYVDKKTGCPKVLKQSRLLWEKQRSDCGDDIEQSQLPF